MVGPCRFESLKGRRPRWPLGLTTRLTLPFLYLPSGHVNFTISTKTVDSNELCGGRKGVVPNRGQSDTLIKPVLVKVSVSQDWHQVEMTTTQDAQCPTLPVSFTALTLYLQPGSFCVLLPWPFYLSHLPNPCLGPTGVLNVMPVSLQTLKRMLASLIKTHDLISCFFNPLQTLLNLASKNFSKGFPSCRLCLERCL